VTLRPPRCPFHRGSAVGGPYGKDPSGGLRWKCVPRRGGPHALASGGFRAAARRLGWEGWGIIVSGPIAVVLLLPSGVWKPGAAAALATLAAVAQTRRIMGYGPWLLRYEELFGSDGEEEEEGEGPDRPR